jgi:hypothetical protein
MLSPLRLVQLGPDGNQFSYVIKFAEILVILGATAALFADLEEDMQTFGYYVYGGMFYVILMCEDLFMSLTTGMLTAVVGAATEHWGCSQQLWNWVNPAFSSYDKPTRSLLMIGGQPYGFPVEVVVAYAGAGFWMSSISKVILRKEHAAISKVGPAKSFSMLQQAGIFLLNILVLYLIWCEPVYRQCLILQLVGWNIAFHIQHCPSCLYATLAWGLVVGCAGFFFEVYATGGVSEDFAVWRYSDAKTASMIAAGTWQMPNPFFITAPVTAFPAYVGTGMIVFGTGFIMTAGRAKDHSRRD